jgi:hypothetical protein
LTLHLLIEPLLSTGFPLTLFLNHLAVFLTSFRGAEAIGSHRAVLLIAKGKLSRGREDFGSFRGLLSITEVDLEERSNGSRVEEFLLLVNLLNFQFQLIIH